MAELNITDQDLCRTMYSIVEEQAVGMQQMNLGSRWRSAFCCSTFWRYGRKQAKTEEQKYTKDIYSLSYHFIQPSYWKSQSLQSGLMRM